MSFAKLVERLTPGQRVFLPGMTGESMPFFEALSQRPEKAAGVTVTGVHFPGINPNDYLSLHPELSFEGYFMSGPLRDGLRSGRGQVFPLDHPAIFRHLQTAGAFDLAIMQVSPPDANGFCSPGISVDFQPAAWERARHKLLHINPAMPATHSPWRLHVDEVDEVIEAEAPLITAELEEPDALSQQLAAQVIKFIEPGATLQFGVGKMPTAVSRGLQGLTRLNVNSGLITPAVSELVNAAVVDRVTAGVALGDEGFYASLAGDDRYRFAPVSETHDLAALASIDRFCSINSAVEVDLFGQVNADSAGGRLIAGVGGLPVYVQAATISPGGRSIICLPSQVPARAEKPSRSRIVARLGQGALTAIPRHLTDTVITEHGAAELRGLSLIDRARALIAIAAPEHQEALERQWRDIESAL